MDVSNIPWLQSHEFIVGIVVGVILLSALGASPLFRNVALALAAGGIILLYLQGGIPSLLTLSQTLVAEFRAIPDFSNGMLVGLAIGAVLVLGFKQRILS